MEIKEIDESKWQQLLPILPAENGRQGRPSIDNRKIINGILWRFQSKEAWRNVPEKYGKWITVYQRFRRWNKDGIWSMVAPICFPGCCPEYGNTCCCREDAVKDGTEG